MPLFPAAKMLTKVQTKMDIIKNKIWATITEIRNKNTYICLASTNLDKSESIIKWTAYVSDTEELCTVALSKAEMVAHRSFWLCQAVLVVVALVTKVVWIGGVRKDKVLERCIVQVSSKVFSDISAYEKSIVYKKHRDIREMEEDEISVESEEALRQEDILRVVIMDDNTDSHIGESDEESNNCLQVDELLGLRKLFSFISARLCGISKIEQSNF
ncbi:unnamed protein product [Thelazia callipaeda]|uniref:Ig-like domain-containing protein n=1 Tax=Thelazia callipaeda TaxID=103827 RepID=A0A0N5D4W7_THECL|nr:unnamed protein product [Thelazia callipaeda]